MASARMVLPVGGVVSLTLLGEPDSPIDLTPFVQPLLVQAVTRVHLAPTAPAPLSDGVLMVDFGVLDAPENAHFYVDGAEMPTMHALELLRDEVTLAIIAAIHSAPDLPSEIVKGT